MADGESRKEALAKLEGMNHPLRMRILTALILKPSSAKDLAAELGLPIGRVRYQLGRMRKVGLAELREQRPRRGVVERIYFIRPDYISIEDASHLEPEEMSQAHVEILKAMVHDSVAALRTGTFSAHDDFMAARIPLRLDEEGWKQASAVQHEALNRLIEIHAESSARLDRSESDSIRALGFLLLFEAAPPAAYRHSAKSEFTPGDASAS